MNIIVSFILSVLFVIGVNGVKAIALSILTFKMRSVINSAEYSCISNAVASLAGGVVPTVIGKIIDSAGWSVSYLVVFGLTLALIVSLVIIDAVLKKHGEKTVMPAKCK